MKDKKLFAIKELATGKLLANPMFTDKQEAKKHRKKVNGITKEGAEIFTYVVTYGPDHDKFDAETARIKPVKQTEVTSEEVETVA